jgi:Tfp pilus assembly protein PilN
MLKLNLIAEEAKKTIKYQRLYSLSLQVEIFLLVLCLFVGAIIFSAEKVLAANVHQSGLQTAALISSSSADYDTKATDLNQKMAAVAQIESGFISYSRIILGIYALVPASSSLSYLNINSGANAIEIRGLSPTRDDLLNLEASLKSAAWLSNVNVPLEEKFNKTNINFDIVSGFDLKKMPTSNVNY